MAETAFLANRETWERIYTSGGSFLRYPDEHLMRIVHLIEVGFECYACEVSPVALRITAERLRTRNLSAELTLLDGSGRLSYEDDFFDAITCWEVFYYNDIDSFARRLVEIHRILKPGGKLIATMMRPDDVNPTSADFIGNHAYRVVSSPTHAGTVIFVPENEDHLRRLFSRFQNLEIGYFSWHFGGITSSHWIIWGERKVEKELS